MYVNVRRICRLITQLNLLVNFELGFIGPKFSTSKL